MPYVVFPSQPATIGVGRTASDGCVDPVTGEYACAVDEVLDGETEISAEQHARCKAAAEEYEANRPPPELVIPPPPPPSLGALLAPEMAGLTAAITELRDSFATNANAKVAAEKMAARTDKMKQVLERG